MNAPTLSPATVAPLHPVRKACIEAAMKLVALQFKRIEGEPKMSDAKELQQDLDVLTEIFDAVIKSVGEYASSNFGRIDMALFTDVSRDALDGNGTYAIEEAARLYVEERAA